MPSTLTIPSLVSTTEMAVCEKSDVAASEAASAHRYYRNKVAAIIDRYGPGPRVHYHIGLFDNCWLPPCATAEQIRERIVAAQERLLQRAGLVWDAGSLFTKNLLDVGCGLGGGAIYWAQNFRVRVTAVTNVAEQGAVTRRFAADAGVADRVRTLVTDICDLRLTRRYRAAVAVESSCYVPRPRLFERIAAALEPGGIFGIEDIFLAQPAWGALFDVYWKTRIGTLSQYQQAAEQAGMVMDRNVDITTHTTAFWLHSLAWAWARLCEPGVSTAEEERLMRSIRWHSRFLHGWCAGAYQTRILRFRKRG